MTSGLPQNPGDAPASDEGAADTIAAGLGGPADDALDLLHEGSLEPLLPALLQRESKPIVPEAVLAPAPVARPGAPRILVVDDQKNMRATTALVLAQEGYEVAESESGEKALQRLLTEPFDVVITDLKMQGLDGMAVLKGALEISPTTQVLVMTGFGTVEGAVSAMQLGASDYLTKPFKDQELLVRVTRALEKRRLLLDNTLLAGEFRAKYQLDALVGRSAPMRELLTRLLRVAATDVTVLITGESGTGKELIARALHANSKRATRPFVPINCAAISETLLESELFGHERGAFTGAVKARRGLLEEASGGTFFFDEIGETTPQFQAKLLRVIQEHEIRPVGGNNSVPVDVRVVAATNQDLRKAIAEKRFREDLFYRLNVVPLSPPPLRERKEDIPLLANHFVGRFNRREGTRRILTHGALEKLMAHDFPGNVRELENVVEQAAALAHADAIGAGDVHLETDASRSSTQPLMRLVDVVDAAERHAIEASLARNQGQIEKTARELGVSTPTLWRKMKRLDLKK
ncbi:MAG: sigma-54-dependent Fis family transcriptional regulator [Deltaproteobacteria bacterium]|nr:sigma-54-dependent Fis family transcriptional regulator [Deltaproteobacteria bacterium]